MSITSYWLIIPADSCIKKKRGIPDMLYVEYISFFGNDVSFFVI